jgi:Predicted pyrophosphatase
MEEVGEMARIMARTYGEQSFKAGESAEQLGPEMADVLWVLLCLANQCGIDLEKELRLSLEKKQPGIKIGTTPTPNCKPRPAPNGKARPARAPGPRPPAFQTWGRR